MTKQDVKVKNIKIHDLVAEKLGYTIDDDKLSLTIQAEVTEDTYIIFNGKGKKALEASFSMEVEDIEGYDVLKNRKLTWTIGDTEYSYVTQLADFEMPQTYLVNVLLNRIFRVSRTRGGSVNAEQRAKLIEERRQYKESRKAPVEEV